MTAAKIADPAILRTSEVRFASDSPLEGDGFELPVPHAAQGRPKAIIIVGFGCVPRRSIICGCRRWTSAKAGQSEIPKRYPRGTGCSNPGPSSAESTANLAVSHGSERRWLNGNRNEPCCTRRDPHIDLSGILSVASGSSKRHARPSAV
jgi:hypothetical protein